MSSVDPSISSDQEHDSPLSSPFEKFSPTRCTTCNAQPNPKSQNLVVCIDGTSNRFGQNNTNVVKLFAKINLETQDPQPKQYTYYTSGIGTRPKTLNVFDRVARAVSDKFDMAFAWNIEEIVKDAYGWLARMYQEGDQVYLFGFSRGAYQVRVLAGMIHEVGLIRSPTEKQVGAAYDHYRSIRWQNPQTRGMVKEFKKTFSRIGLRVHFVGVWDMVSSVGLVQGDDFISTSSSAARACHIRHALALDERRVKFMPDYFHEMNARPDMNAGDGEGKKSKYVVEEKSEVSADQGKVTEVENSKSIGVEKPKRFKPSKIKEVWFAGSHSDVGGRHRPGTAFQAGNVSLLWMRREASPQGLILKPTDIVWVPADLDFGTRDSMSAVWSTIEYLPVLHQVSFSGAGENARRGHLFQPRRIIPGQKIHASILFADAYRPVANLGSGFSIPIRSPSDTELDSELWETGFFDNTTAGQLITCLGRQERDAPVYLDRLLFMLRFPEGKASIRKVPNWQKTFEDLVKQRSGFIKLVMIVAYFEASYEELHRGSPAPGLNFPKEVFDHARQCFKGILASHKHRDFPRAVALLRPLTKHEVLRQQILMPDVIITLIRLLDEILDNPDEKFSQIMNGLGCLVECNDLQDTVVQQLGSESTRWTKNRLSRMLGVDDLNHLTASLRVIVSIARIQKVVDACAMVKPRLRELARQHKGLIGQMAVEALLELYNPAEEEQLAESLHNSNVLANLTSTLNLLNIEISQDSSFSSGHRNGRTSHQLLGQIFGLGVETLNAAQQKLIHELMLAVGGSSARERTAATFTLLKLCEVSNIRMYLLERGVLDIFINQLLRRDSSLLAAYALTICLKHDEMENYINHHQLVPKRIVNMLILDYFDDAVGRVEGFHVFYGLMKHDNLRQKIREYDITAVLERKLTTGQPKEIRTSLICLDIFRSFDENDPCTRALVEKGIERLQSKDWKTQKKGAAILSALACTGHGGDAIKTHIQGMFLSAREGAQIFSDLMTSGELKQKFSGSSTEDLEEILGEIFWSFDKEGPSGQHLAQKRSDSLQNKEWITQPEVDNDESGLDGMNEDGMAATESFNLPYDDLTMMISGKGTSPTCAGAFGKIWKCTMIRNHGASNVHGSGTPVQVAVKTVEQSPKDGEWDVIYKHLRRELKVWARLSHTNIVPFLGITCNFGPLPAMVSPWYENGSLSAYLDVHPELPLSKKLSLLCDVANGLQYLHSQTPAVVHGDLHTGNVLIDNDGRACLTDFGLSLVIQEFSETSYLQSSVCGNLHYAAPELVNALAQSTGPLAYPKEPADIYSFGCIMMRVLTGEHPFKGVNIIALCTKICLEKRPSLPKSPGTSLETQAIMKRCWADAKTRPAATKVAQLLSELIRA